MLKLQLHSRKGYTTSSLATVHAPQPTMAGMARSVPSGASAALQLLFFACSMHQLQQAAAQTTANNGDCCMSLLKEDWLTEKEMLEPDRVAGSGGPGETLTDDLTTGVDYELFFTIALPDHSKDDGTFDKLWGVPMQAGDDTVQADGKIPKMGLAFITECCKDEDNGLARNNGLYRAKNDWPRPGQPAGTDLEEQGMQAIPFLFFHSRRGLVLSVYDPARGLGTATARIGNGNGWGFGADPDGNRYNDRGDSMTTKKGAKYQDILAGKTVDVRIVVSGKYHALFAGDELLFEPYEMWTRDRDVTESARVKMGGVSVAQGWNPPKTLTQSIKNVRYFRRNHDEGVGLECTANLECPFLAANVATAANWRSVLSADVCGISKVPAGDDAASCNVEATRWFNAEKICTDVGARLCTRAELEAGALVDISRVDAAGDDLDEDLCEDTAAASPVWVADTCAISDPAGALGHQVVLSTGAAYGDGGLCIPEMIPLDETPKDTSGNAVVPLVRCCGSGTTSTTVTTTPTSTATTTPTSTTRTTTTSSISSTTTSATSTTTSVSTTSVSATPTTTTTTTTTKTSTSTTTSATTKVSSISTKTTAPVPYELIHKGADGSFAPCADETAIARNTNGKFKFSKNVPLHFVDLVTDADITNLVPKCSNACGAEEECFGLYVFMDGTTPKCRLLKILGNKDAGEESTITDSNDPDLSCSYKRPDHTPASTSTTRLTQTTTTTATIVGTTTIDKGSLYKEVSRLENEMLSMYAAIAIAKVSKVTCSDGMVQARDTEAGIGFVCTFPCVAGKAREQLYPYTANNDCGMLETYTEPVFCDGLVDRSDIDTVCYGSVGAMGVNNFCRMACMNCPTTSMSIASTSISSTTTTVTKSSTTLSNARLVNEIARLENEMKELNAALAIARVSKVACSDGMVQAQDTKAGIGFLCTLPCASKDPRDCEDDYCVANGAAAFTYTTTSAGAPLATSITSVGAGALPGAADDTTSPSPDAALDPKKSSGVETPPPTKVPADRAGASAATNTTADLDLEKGSNLGIIIGVVVAVVVIAGIVLLCVCRSKSTSDPEAAFVNDAAAVQRRPKPKRAPLDQRRRSAGSRQNSNGRLSSSWMQDATRATAETLLKGCRSGTFFVRPRNDTSYAFSVIIRNRVVHKLIKEAAPGEFTVDGKGGEWGSSLESVVAVVSLQMGTKYECAMYPLSAAAKQPEKSARRPIRGMANAQPRTPARNDAGARANITTGEQTYEEIDDGFGDAAMQEKTYEEIDESGSINNPGVYETAFTLNAAYSTVQESAAAASASASQQSVQVRRISGYENTGARANRGPDVPAVTVNPHYHNDDATNDPTAVQNSTADPYASLLADASAYGTTDGTAVDFDYDDTDDYDVEI